ncbi:MAG TPA: hypothetical protein VN931_12075 [Fibrobacteria bacterium]|nr:hypothetical protein [Fibrobacteria bacterium]
MKNQHRPLAGIAVAASLLVPCAARAGVIDAVSGASIAILAGTTTTTGTAATANVNWRFNDGHAGQGTCVISLTGALAKSYTVPASARTNERTSATYAITGLAAKSTYSFTIKISEGGNQANSGKATFTTDAGTSSILGKGPYAGARPPVGYDVFGRRLGRVPQDLVGFGPGGAQFDPTR